MFGFFKKDKKEPELPKERYIDKVLKITSVDIDDADCPFKLKRNEEYIGSVGATLYLYKSDGNIAGAGITARIKIVKGIYFRAGAGKMVANKSWQPDQHGTLHITSDRIIFNGDNKNVNTRWNKVIEFTFDHDDGEQLEIGRESGPDWIFALDEALSPEQMAAALHYQQNV